MDIELIWKIAGIVFACGMLYAELQSIKRSIYRLEKKQDAYNGLQIRVAKNEVKLDNIDKEIADIKNRLN